MAKALICYLENNSKHYDRKLYVQPVPKIRRDKSAKGPLAVGEIVTVKEKKRVWEAVVVTPDYHPPKRK